jgi:tetratricopeptide (TPR) repeat protein
LRGLIYLEQGRFEEARKDFRAAAEANPARFAPKLHVGDAFLREKKFTEAREVYLDLMRETNVQVSMEKARYGLLLTYLFTQDEARAHAALDRIGFPTASPAYYYAQGAWEFAHGHSDDAKKWLQAAGKMFDGESIAWFARPLYSYGWLEGKPPVPAS